MKRGRQLSFPNHFYRGRTDERRKIAAAGLALDFDQAAQGQSRVPRRRGIHISSRLPVLNNEINPAGIPMRHHRLKMHGISPARVAIRKQFDISKRGQLRQGRLSGASLFIGGQGGIAAPPKTRRETPVFVSAGVELKGIRLSRRGITGDRHSANPDLMMIEGIQRRQDEELAIHMHQTPGRKDINFRVIQSHPPGGENFPFHLDEAKIQFPAEQLGCVSPGSRRHLAGTQPTQAGFDHQRRGSFPGRVTPHLNPIAPGNAVQGGTQLDRHALGLSLNHQQTPAIIADRDHPADLDRISPSQLGRRAPGDLFNGGEGFGWNIFVLAGRDQQHSQPQQNNP